MGFFSISHSNGLCAESRGRLQSAEALDHDWRSSSVASSDQEHGVSEVLQHGTVSLRALCSSWCSDHWPWRPRSCKAKVNKHANWIALELWHCWSSLRLSIPLFATLTASLHFLGILWMPQCDNLILQLFEFSSHQFVHSSYKLFLSKIIFVAKRHLHV